MFRELRNKQRALSSKEAYEVLERGEYGVLSTMGTDGYPYGVPVSYIFLDGSIYFHSALEGHKVEAMNREDKVSFVVVGHTSVKPESFTLLYSSAIAFGRATQVEGEEKRRALSALVERFSPEFIEEGTEYIERAADKTAVIRIDIDHISGKARTI